MNLSGALFYNVLYQEQCNLLSQIIAGQMYVFVILIVFWEVFQIHLVDA